MTRIASRLFRGRGFVLDDYFIVAIPESWGVVMFGFLLVEVGGWDLYRGRGDCRNVN